MHLLCETNLLVGKHEQNGIPQLILIQHAVQLIASLRSTTSVIGIDDKDQTLRVLEVVAPERTDLVLTSDIPHREVDVLVFHGLDVEPNRGNGCNDLTQLQFVQDGGLTGGVQADEGVKSSSPDMAKLTRVSVK